MWGVLAVSASPLRLGCWEPLARTMNFVLLIFSNVSRHQFRILFSYFALKFQAEVWKFSLYAQPIISNCFQYFLCNFVSFSEICVKDKPMAALVCKGEERK